MRGGGEEETLWGKCKECVREFREVNYAAVRLLCLMGCFCHDGMYRRNMRGGCGCTDLGLCKRVWERMRRVTEPACRQRPARPRPSQNRGFWRRAIDRQARPRYDLWFWRTRPEREGYEPVPLFESEDDASDAVELDHMSGAIQPEGGDPRLLRSEDAVANEESADHSVTNEHSNPFADPDGSQTEFEDIPLESEHDHVDNAESMPTDDAIYTPTLAAKPSDFTTGGDSDEASLDAENPFN